MRVPIRMSNSLRRRDFSAVITGLDPVIHVLLDCRDKDVDGRVKPGHNEREVDASRNAFVTGLMVRDAARCGSSP